MFEIPVLVFDIVCPSQIVYVGALECSQQGDFQILAGDLYTLNCTLPVGSGLDVDVYASNQDNILYQSDSLPFVSYAVPDITRLSADTCNNENDMTLRNCSRTTNTMLT